MVHNERILKALQRTIQLRIIIGQSDENYCSIFQNCIELNEKYFQNLCNCD